MWLHAVFLTNRSSYPDRKEGEDATMEEEELPDDKNLEYDDDTLELTLPSGDETEYDMVPAFPVSSGCLYSTILCCWAG